MASIGDAWVDGAWIQAAWVTTTPPAWEGGDADTSSDKLIEIDSELVSRDLSDIDSELIGKSRIVRRYT